MTRLRKVSELSARERIELLESYGAEGDAGGLAAAYGLANRGQVYGLAFRAKVSAPRDRAPISTARERALERYGREGGAAAVAAELGVTPSAVRALASRHAVRSPRRPRGSHQLSRNQLWALERYAAEGNAEVTGPEHGMTPDALRSLAKRRGVSSARRLDDGERRRVLALAQEGCSQNEVARRMGRSRLAVRRVLERQAVAR